MPLIAKLNIAKISLTILTPYIIKYCHYQRYQHRIMITIRFNATEPTYRDRSVPEEELLVDAVRPPGVRARLISMIGHSICIDEGYDYGGKGRGKTKNY